MAVEIRELVIRTTIDNGKKKSKRSKKGKSRGGGGEDIVSECVEQVMELLERQKGR